MKTYDHSARPDDMPDVIGENCKDCGEAITWTGPTQYDWQHIAEQEPESVYFPHDLAAEIMTVLEDHETEGTTFSVDDTGRDLMVTAILADKSEHFFVVSIRPAVRHISDAGRVVPDGFTTGTLGLSS